MTVAGETRCSTTAARKSAAPDGSVAGAVRCLLDHPCMEYRYTHFSPRVVLDELRSLTGGLPIGASLPRFVLPTADGGTFDTATVIGTRPLVITLASIT